MGKNDANYPNNHLGTHKCSYKQKVNVHSQDFALGPGTNPGYIDANTKYLLVMVGKTAKCVLKHRRLLYERKELL